MYEIHSDFLVLCKNMSGWSLYADSVHFY